MERGDGRGATDGSPTHHPTHKHEAHIRTNTRVKAIQRVREDERTPGPEKKPKSDYTIGSWCLKCCRGLNLESGLVHCRLNALEQLAPGDEPTAATVAQALRDLDIDTFFGRIVFNRCATPSAVAAAV